MRQSRKGALTSTPCAMGRGRFMRHHVKGRGTLICVWPLRGTSIVNVPHASMMPSRSKSLTHQYVRQAPKMLASRVKRSCWMQRRIRDLRSDFLGCIIWSLPEEEAVLTCLCCDLSSNPCTKQITHTDTTNMKV